MDILIFLFHKDTPKMMCSGVVWAVRGSDMQNGNGIFCESMMIQNTHAGVGNPAALGYVKRGRSEKTIREE